jgi:hypothetical protein
MVYIISSEEDFKDGRAERLANLGFTVVRANPVSTNQSRCSLPRFEETPEKTRGIFLAHRAVWNAIAGWDRVSGGTGVGALVLETDFWVGNATDEELKTKLDEAWWRDEDFTNVGWCDLCYFHGREGEQTFEQCREDSGARYGCATAYIIRPDFAAALGRTDWCFAADTMFQFLCHEPYGNGWSLDPGVAFSDAPDALHDRDSYINMTLRMKLRSQLRMGRLPRCTYLHEPPQVNGTIFRGIFQQNTDRYGGSHDNNPVHNMRSLRVREQSRGYNQYWESR